jgi:hypothetical protein
MKLLLCQKCRDVQALRLMEPRTCECGASSGHYDINGDQVVLSGAAKVLCITNSSIRYAILNPGKDVAAWVLPDDHFKIGRDKEGGE